MVALHAPWPSHGAPLWKGEVKIVVQPELFLSFRAKLHCAVENWDTRLRCRPFLLLSRNVRPVTSISRTVANTLPVLLEHISMPLTIKWFYQLKTFFFYHDCHIYKSIFFSLWWLVACFLHNQRACLHWTNVAFRIKGSGFRPDRWADIVKGIFKSRFSKSHFYHELDTILLFVLICGLSGEGTVISAVYTNWYYLMLYGDNVLRNMLSLECKMHIFCN